MKNYESKKPYQQREPLESQRNIEKRYSLLVIEPAKADRFNCYVCYNPECMHITKAVDIHVGVTPMFLSCTRCGNMATSTMYRDIAPDIKPEIEWFVPTLKQVMKMRNNPAMLDHIFMGGLEMRKVKP
ncbi:hypothetical protein D3C87_1494910 [compost metagenome]